MLNSFKNGRYQSVNAALVFVTNGSMRKLAGSYLGERKTTDVLSFPYLDTKSTVSGKNKNEVTATPWEMMFSPTLTEKYTDTEIETAPATVKNEMSANTIEARDDLLSNDLGTLIIAPDYCSRVAKRRGIAAPHYILMAVAHGLAHLAGHDHETDVEYMDMKKAEEKAMQTISETIRNHGNEGSNINSIGLLPKSYLE